MAQVQNDKASGQKRATCNVNMTFNFMVGAISTIVAIIAGYVIYRFLS